MSSKHNIPPVFDEHSRVLVLGSFPSVKSREKEFFYAHPQNRFWRVLSFVLGCDAPCTVPQKKELLLAHGIALWDVLAVCDVVGSADSSIKNTEPNNLREIFTKASIEKVILNGKTAEKYYKKYFADIKIPVVSLPSTSPANASVSFDELVRAWNVIK